MKNKSSQRQIKSRQNFKKTFGENKWIAENRLTKITAKNNRQNWTDKDDRLVALSGLSVIKKAVLLGRTKNAVAHRIKTINKKQK